MTPQQVAEQAAVIQTALNESVTAARNDPDLTPEGRHRRLSGAYITALDSMAKLQESYTGESKSRVEELRRDLFGAGEASGMDAISLRDASDRASRLENTAEALNLLEQAENNSDEVLARAIAQHAFIQTATIFGSDWLEVVDAYAVRRPDVTAKLEELHEARADDVRDSMAEAAVFYVGKPAELERDTEHRIRILAEAQASTGPRRTETQADRNKATGATLNRSQGYDFLARHQGLS